MSAGSDKESELIRKIAQLEVELLKSQRRTDAPQREGPTEEFREVAREYAELRKALDEALEETPAPLDWDREPTYVGGEAAESALLGEEILSIKKGLEEREDEIFRSSVMVSGFEGRIKELEAGFREKEEMLSSKNKEVRALSEIVKKRNEQLDELKDRIRELEGGGVERENEIALRDSLIKELEEGSENLRGDLEKLRKSMKAKNLQIGESGGRIKTLEARVKELESALDKANSEILEKDSMTDVLEGGLASTKQKMEEVQAVLHEKKNELTDSLKTIKSLERKGKGLERTCAELRKKLKAAEREAGVREREVGAELRKKLKAAEREVGVRERKVGTALKKITELNKSRDLLGREAEAGGKEIASLRGKLKTLEKVNMTLKKELGAVKKTAGMKDKKLKEAAGLKRKLGTVEKAGKKKEKALKESSRKIKELKKTLKAVELNVREREEVIAMQLEEIGGLKDTAPSTPESEKLESAVKLLEEKLGEKIEAVEEKEREIEKRDKEIENMRGEINAREGEVSALKAKMKELEKKKAKAKVAPRLEGFLEDVDGLFEKFKEVGEVPEEPDETAAAIKVVDLILESRGSGYEAMVWNNGSVPLTDIKVYVNGELEGGVPELGIDERAVVPVSRVAAPGEYELKVTSKELAGYVCKRKI